MNVSLLLFLLCTAMTCEDEFIYNVKPVDFTLSHVYNGGEKPVEIENGSDEKVIKDAYVLKMDLKLVLSDSQGGVEEEVAFAPDYEYRLENPITKIEVFSLRQQEGELIRSKDMTDDFRCYQIDNKPDKYRILPLPMSYIDKVVNLTLYLALYNVPVDEGAYQFEVNMVLHNGDTLKQVTEPIMLIAKDK